MNNDFNLCIDKRPFWCREAFLLMIILIITFLIYLPALNNAFTNWDDTWYVTDNAQIGDSSMQGLLWWFTHYFHGQYSPIGNVVTVLLFQIDGLNPFWYHLASLVLHLVNIALVFVFVKKLSSRIIIGLFVALFFAVHPLQTESIAWVAAIKIPLYGMFTLIALIWYLRFLDTGKWRWYLLALIPFLMSYGCKEQSMALVGSLIFIDYYRGRNVFSRKVLLEKLPWLVMGILMGLNSIAATASFGVVTPAKSFGINEQLIIPSYAFITYLWKLVVPAGMAAIYPYPTETASLPWFYYLCFILVIAIIVVFVRSWKRNKTLVFGIGFFVTNIILVLQIVPTRNIIIADRYVYLPLIGFFFIVAEYLFRIIKKGSALRIIMLLVLMIWVGGLSLHSISRNRVWESPETLWSDVVEKQPDALIGWYDLANWYADNSRHEDAVRAYAEVLRINPVYYNGLYNMGNSYYRLGEYHRATSLYKKALEVWPDSKSAALNMFMALIAQNRNQEAAMVIEILEKQFPGDSEVASKKAVLPSEDTATGAISEQQLFNLAEKAFNEKRFDDAVLFYTRTIEEYAPTATLHYNRGNAYFILEMYHKAIEDYSKSISMNASFADSWFNRAMAYKFLGDTESFCADMRQSAALGNTKAAERVQKMCD